MPTVDAAALLIGLREGLEALLILGILLAILRRLGHPDKTKHVCCGMGSKKAGQCQANARACSG